MNELKFKNFDLGDFDAVIALWQESGIILSRSDTLTGLAQKLERDPELFFVATNSKNKILGCVMGTYDGRRGWINHLAVHPSRQGEGLGKLIVEELENRLRKIGCEKINLLIEPANLAVQNFYERLDYSTDHLLFMEKWL